MKTKGHKTEPWHLTSTQTVYHYWSNCPLAHERYEENAQDGKGVGRRPCGHCQNHERASAATTP